MENKAELDGSYQNSLYFHQVRWIGREKGKVAIRKVRGGWMQNPILVWVIL